MSYALCNLINELLFCILQINNIESIHGTQIDVIIEFSLHYTNYSEEKFNQT